jgi:hypothetical protein
MRKKMSGCCGIPCNECPAFIALKTNDDALREKTAQEWSQRYSTSFSKEMINCSGCTNKKGPHIGHCGVCSIRNCVLKKGLKKCVSCEEFKFCETRQQFEKETQLKCC